MHFLKKVCQIRTIETASRKGTAPRQTETDGKPSRKACGGKLNGLLSGNVSRIASG